MKIAADKDIAEGAQDVQIVQTRANVAIAFKDDIGITLARDVIFRNVLPPWATWRILAVPTSLEYLCAGIVAFLFVSAWRGK